MKRNMRLSFQKGDMSAVLVVVFLIVLSYILFVPKTDAGGGRVEIFKDGERIHVFSLTEDRTIFVDGEYRNKISIQDGRAAIIESNCPGADCVHTGWISSAGRSAFCLPNRVEVRITQFDEVDFVVR
ncbi:MAG: NusG domain II-containing protein [Clostridia bacterium]|nr:NusG domain II-containing protein [Clostridia bacterium]